MNARPYWERPCAARGLHSFRYRGQFGFVMIGALDCADALQEAKRSLEHSPDPARLERWNGAAYVPAMP